MSDLIIELATDAEAWKEGDHPREKDGKFTAGSGSTGGSSPSAPVNQPSSPAQLVTKTTVQPTAKVKNLLDKAGFEFHHTHPSGNPIYKHALSNAFIQIHKPGHVPGSESSHWKLEHEYEKHSGKNAPPLAALLDKLVGLGLNLSEQHPAVQKKPKAPPMNVAKPLQGFQPVETPSGTVIEKTESPKIDLTAIKEAAPGYSNFKPGVNPESVIIHKPDHDAAVEINMKTGEWVAQSVGHMTKEGNGLASLSNLLAGKPGEYKNTSKTISDPEKAAAEKAAAEKAAAEETNETKLKKKLNAAAPDPTPNERSAISSYTGSYYTSINSALRKHAPLTGNLKSTVDHINSYLDKCAMPEDVVVWRGLGGAHAEQLKQILEKGAKFKEKGFMSSSISEKFAKGWSSGLLLKVTAPKGTKGAFVKSMSHHPHENEVIFKSGHWVHVDHFDPVKNYAEVTILEE